MLKAVKKKQAAPEDMPRIVRNAVQSALTRSERFRQSGPFGDLTGSRLTSILAQAERGDIAQWAMLCDFARGTDETLAGLYETRRLRVRQADVRIVPGRKRPTADDVLAVDMCEAALDLIEDLDNSIDRMLLSHSEGWSFTEILGWGEDSRGYNLPRALQTAHPRRFRFDEHWQPRKYEQGNTPGADGYGEILNPYGKWIINMHPAGNVYPGTYGIQRSLAWLWLFRRWASRFWIEHLDRYGSPFTYAIVEKNTPPSVRDDVQASLERLTSEHVAVFEQGGQIKMDAAASGSGSDEQFERYMNACTDAMSRRILGTSDLSGPGANGSRAAVDTRVAASVDPRTRADVKDFWGTMRRDLFRWILINNADKFSSTPAVPEAKLLDEIGTSEDVQATALAGAQQTATLDTIARAQSGEIPVSAAKVVVRLANPGMPQEQLDAMFADVGKRGFDTLPRQPLDVSRTPDGDATPQP